MAKISVYPVLNSKAASESNACLAARQGEFAAQRWARRQADASLRKENWRWTRKNKKMAAICWLRRYGAMA
jgi:hypothetical protein